MKKALAIINRTAGMGQKAELEAALIRNLKSQDYETVIKYTKPTGFKHIVMKHEPDTDLFVVAGGDGTVSELISILVSENIKTPAAVIPAGTVNDFARANDIPLNPVTAAKTLDTTSAKTVDTIQLNENYAGYLVAFGNFMTSFAKVKSSVKNKLGRAAYLIRGIRTIISLKTYRLNMKVDQVEMEIDSVFTVVSKISSVGSVEKLIPEAKSNDGLLHILNVAPVKFKELLPLILKAFKGDITDHPKVTYLTAEQIEIRSNDLEDMNIDGDINDYEDVKISVVKNGITLVKHKTEE